jgi:hypothetical protein
LMSLLRISSTHYSMLLFVPCAQMQFLELPVLVSTLCQAVL